jgi:hypothetical protein
MGTSGAAAARERLAANKFIRRPDGELDQWISGRTGFEPQLWLFDQLISKYF